MKSITRIISIGMTAALLWTTPGLGCFEAFARGIETRTVETQRGIQFGRAAIEHSSNGESEAIEQADQTNLVDVGALSVTPELESATVAAGSQRRNDVTARQELTVAADRFSSKGAPNGDVMAGKNAQDSFYTGADQQTGSNVVNIEEAPSRRMSPLKRLAVGTAATVAALGGSVLAAAASPVHSSMSEMTYNSALTHGFFGAEGAFIGGVMSGVLLKGMDYVAKKYDKEIPWQVDMLTKALGMVAGMVVGSAYFPQIAAYLQAIMPSIASSYLPGISILGGAIGVVIGSLALPQRFRDRFGKAHSDKLSFAAYLGTIGIVITTWPTATTIAPFAFIAIPAFVSWLGSWMTSHAADMPHVLVNADLEGGKPQNLLALPALVSLMTTLGFMVLSLDFQTGVVWLTGVVGFVNSYAVAGYFLQREADGTFKKIGTRLFWLAVVGTGIGIIAGIFVASNLLQILPHVGGL